MARPKITIDGPAVEKLAAQGLSEKQIAEVLGISWNTLAARKRESKQFFEFLNRGKAKGLAVITNALFEQAKQGNYQAINKYLSTRDRANWGDKQQLDHTSSDGTMSPNTTQAVLDALARKHQGEAE